MLSPAQYSCLSLISSDGSRFIGAVNTLTLASLSRRGYIEIKGRQNQKQMYLSQLGLNQYEFELTHKLKTWKEDLAEARKLKGSRRK